jgi:hypothetical protein
LVRKNYIDHPQNTRNGRAKAQCKEEQRHVMPRAQSLRALALLRPERHAYGRVVGFDGSSQIIDRDEDGDGNPGCDRGVLDRGGAGAITQKGQDFAHVKLNSVLNLASILGNKSCRVLNDFVQIESIGLARRSPAESW